MSVKIYITKSNIPYLEAMLKSDRFVLLNMFKEGIWLVDKEHPKWNDIKETALGIAQTFGDKETLEQLKNI